VSLVKDPLTRARKLGDGQRSAAAQLHADLEAELALNDDLPAGWEADAEQALDDLESRFGGAEQLRELGVDRGKAPQLSRGARKGLDGPHEGRRRAGTTTKGSAGGSGSRSAAGAKSSGGRAGGRTPARRGSRRAGRGGRTLGRAFQRTGLPGAADSATGVGLQLVGLTVGLVLLYSLIRGRGPAAVTIAGRSFVTGLRMIVAPIDPLAPRTRTGGVPAGAGDRAARRGMTVTTAYGNAYERGVANGQLAGPPIPGRVIRRPPTAAAPGGRRPT
jgi:hypothetical protein